MLAPSLPAYPPPNRVERLLDLVFPPTCVGCRRLGRWVCNTCWREATWLDDTADDAAGIDSHLDCIRAAAQFEGVVREAVHALKYEGRHAISATLGRLMAERVRDHSFDAVAPLSLHPSRRRERGYDQSALLARHVAASLDVPLRRDLVRRVRKTRQQASLDRAQRRENVRGAFQVRDAIPGACILLIDDVYTTGATMDEAASALKSAGAAEVVGLVFARAHSDRQ